MRKEQTLGKRYRRCRSNQRIDGGRCLDDGSRQALVIHQAVDHHDRLHHADQCHKERPCFACIPFVEGAAELVRAELKALLDARSIRFVGD